MHHSREFVFFIFGGTSVLPIVWGPDMRLLQIVLIAIFLFQPLSGFASESVSRLIERILPGHGREFDVETIPAPDGQNVFEVEGRNGRIVLRGDSPLSQSVAFNWYLKHCARISVSWYAADGVSVQAKLPAPTEKVRKTTGLKQRFFLNYCTFGYSMPFWHWRDWERFIDWMALNGVNMPLAQNGNEYVWQKVWREYGLGDQEIRAFFTGPAHLPWHRMLNIDKWNGPLPQSYIDGQCDLQKRILAREREFGMTPVLCAFAGHVPEALKARHPEFKIERIAPGWGGFGPDYSCYFLNPLDPVFKEIQVKFLREQEKVYGTSHYYGADPFNEITPPSWEPSYLASVSRAIYEGMAQVDPDCIWLQMAWTFFNDQAHWNEARLSSMIHAVPAGRMELIDYVCENQEIFRSTKAFYGAPFIWSYLGNFGGNTHLVGPVNKISRRISEAMNDSSLPNLAGVGATLEGLNNPVVYELLLDRIWQGPSMDLNSWIRENARARAGLKDANVESAWEVLAGRVLVDKANPILGHGVIFQMSNPSLRGNADWKTNTSIDYQNSDLFQAWELLLKAAPAVRKSASYNRDLVDATRQSLGNLGLLLREKMADAYDKRDAAAFEKAANDFMILGSDIDRLLASRSEFMLSKWINDAKAWAADDGEKIYYERNARALITIWGGNGELLDYANRQWNGLMGDYYLPRWRMLIDATLAELKEGKIIDRVALERKWREHEKQFADASAGNYTLQPSGDSFVFSRALFKKYSPMLPGTKGSSSRSGAGNSHSR
jgi:alpha-N-acetylglucosaminidase